MCVDIRPILVVAGAEGLGFGEQLHVGLNANHGLILHLRTKGLTRGARGVMPLHAVQASMQVCAVVCGINGLSRARGLMLLLGRVVGAAMHYDGA